MLNRFCLLKPLPLNPPPPPPHTHTHTHTFLFLMENIKMDNVQNKIKRKIHALLHYISSFEGTSYKNFVR